jgi:uncharacterized membrane-anchored protein
VGVSIPLVAAVMFWLVRRMRRQLHADGHV